jgi:hypothetical protein
MAGIQQQVKAWYYLAADVNMPDRTTENEYTRFLLFDLRQLSSSEESIRRMGL